MARKFYGASNSYGTNFTYSSPGWDVHVFSSQADREAWIGDDQYPNGNPTRETILLKNALQITPDRDEWLVWTGRYWERQGDIRSVRG